MKLCLFALALLVSLLPAARAASPPLIVILLPGTSLREWRETEAPHLHQLMQTGAIAVMNTRTARLPNDGARESPESALWTLSAGARAGSIPSQSVGYDLHVGNLTDTLAANGVKVQPGGGPASAIVAADGAGRVSFAATMIAKPGVCLIWDAGPDIANADAAIGNAADQVSRRRGRLLVLSPYAGATDYAAGHRLTPVLEWGLGVPAGLLYSPSTRWAGLVTNTDFAPTVAAYFGIPREAFPVRPFGYAWSAKPSVSPTAQAEHLEEQSVHQMQGMRLLPYLAAVLAVWITVCTWLPFRTQRFAARALLPAAALTAALFSVSAASFSIAFCAVLLSAWLAARHYRPAKAAGALAAFTAAALTADLLTGSHGMHQSLLGYSAIEGARYYGIGNEAMGLLVGAALVAADHLWNDNAWRRWACVLGLTALSLLIGLAGSKAGGLLVSAAAFGTFLYHAWGGRWSWRTVIALAAVVTVGMAAAALAEAFWRPQSSSHIGEAVRRIAAGGPGEGLDIVRRKLSVEDRLAFHSAWALLLWGSLACLMALWKQRAANTSSGTALRQAGIVGIGISLIFNDAGVVAAALISTVLWSDMAAQISNAPAPD